MKNTLLLLFLISSFSTITAQDCNSYGDAQIELDVNNIKATLLNSGDMWWDGVEGKYIAPKVEPGFQEVAAIFASAIWIGGENQAGGLQLAIQQYRGGNNTDFFPGPLQFGEILPPSENCSNWDKFWVVNKSEVDDNIADYSDNNTIDNPIQSIYSWPGRNNPHFMDSNGFSLPLDHDLAPFFDNDQDGNYDPDQGDYPLIKGDQSIWWVFNDAAGPHTASSSLPIRVEVQVMAYAEASENAHVNNATYYDFKITNQSNQDLMNAFMGFWVDFDLGCYEDDYMGYDEDYQMMYAYNEDAEDGVVGTSCVGGVPTYGENIPMIGVKQIDNPDYPVSSFLVIERMNENSGIEAPNSAFEYYNILQGRWKDGTPLTSGGTGYNPDGTDKVSFAFTGDPTEENGWSMCSADLPPSDRRGILSTSLSNFSPGAIVEQTYAVVFVEDVAHPCPSLEQLKEATDAVCANLSTSTTEVKKSFNIQLYPNPVTDVLHISSDEPIYNIKLLTIDGKIIKNTRFEKAISTYTLDLGDTSNGLYLVSLMDGKGNSHIEKIVIRR